MQRATLLLLLLVGVFAASSSAAPAVVDIPIYGNYSATFFYYIFLDVGSPSVTYSVVVDTGSSDFFIPQYNCNGCMGDPTTWYFPNQSSTSKAPSCSQYKCDSCDEDQCHTSVNYGGSITEEAILYSDVVSLGSKVSVDTIFGGIYNVSYQESSTLSEWSQLYATQKREFLRMIRTTGQNMGADNDVYYPEGMMGLAYESLTGAHYPPLVDALSQAGQIANIFSLCLQPLGGVLTLGGIGSFSKGSIQYTPLLSEDFYTITVVDFQVEGQSIGVSPNVYNKPGPSIVDSGTPFPTLPIEAYEALRKLMLAQCKKVDLPGICNTPPNKSLFDNTCFKLTPEEIAKFPMFEMVLDGNVSLSYPPTSYLQYMYYCDSPDEVGLALSEDQNFTIVGASLMQLYLTVFDRVNKQVGFAPEYGCPGASA